LEKSVLNYILPEDLDKVFRYASLENEINNKRLDKHRRIDENALEWDISRPWIDDKILAIIENLAIEQKRKMNRPKQFSIVFTHDVDEVTFLEPTSLVKSFITTFLKREGYWAGIGKIFDLGTVLKSFQKMLELENSMGVTSWFFLLSGPYSMKRYGTRYDIRWHSAKRHIEMIKAHGMNIGLHSNYYAQESNAYTIEAKVLSEAVESEIIAHRHHYLRFNSKTLWNSLEKARIKYDFSVGFTTKMGFRAGMGSAYHAYDWVQDKESPVIEIPLIYMESHEHLQQSERTLELMENLLKKVQNIGGTVSILVHPIQFAIDERWFGFYKEMMRITIDLGANVSGILPAAGN
jgi:hypothetical protein